MAAQDYIEQQFAAVRFSANFHKPILLRMASALRASSARRTQLPAASPKTAARGCQ